MMSLAKLKKVRGMKYDFDTKMVLDDHIRGKIDMQFNISVERKQHHENE